MAKKKVVKTTKKVVKPTESKVRRGQTQKQAPTASTSSFGDMLFKKENFWWMFAGIGLIVLGLFLMSGGSMPDSETWDADRIYSFRRITLAPIVILAGLGLQIYAIFKK